MSTLNVIPPLQDETPLTVSEEARNVASPRPKPSGGLSELSKQLRLLQAKNQSQAVEIDRLERQRRILSDLQGISVSDLQAVLRRACEAEAYGELQGRIVSLRAELETALAKVPAGAAAQNESNSKKIANLELRVGELEELEEKQRVEIKKLYSQLMGLQGNVTRLESQNEHYRMENEQLKLELELLKESSTDIERQSPGRITFVTNADAAEAELMRGKPWSRSAAAEAQSPSVATAAAAATREAETEAQILREKLEITQQQQEAAEQQSKLRNAQYKARFMVQEENIADLLQQLQSLYAAFELLKEEKAKDDEVRLALQTYLGQADSEVARQVRDLDRTYVGHTIIKGSTTTDKRKNIVSPEPSPLMKPVVASELLIKSSFGVIKKWKHRNVRLFSTLAHHILDIEKRGYTLEFGVSKVDPYPTKAFGFVINLGPGRELIYAACINQLDYRRWMAALTYATSGAEYNNGSDPDETIANARRSVTRIPSSPEEEKMQLDRALEVSESEH
jgi:hypothetical protein